MKQDKYNLASILYKNMSMIFPDKSNIFYLTMGAFVKSKRISEAKDLLETWLLSHPNDSQAVDWLSILPPPPPQ